MKVLVTGGAGFVGSHLTKLLATSGHDVMVVDDLSTGFVHNVAAGIPLHQADIRSPLDPIFRMFKPEVVVHLAAQVSVPNSVIDPLRDLAINVAGTVNVMLAAARAGVRKVVSVSSAAVYGIPTQFPLRESSPTQPVSPYGLSKLAGEQYVRLLGDLHGVAYSILRPANVFGPGQTTLGEGAVVPAFLDRFLSDVDPVIHGDGSQTRDFLYVTDMVRAIEKAMYRGDGEVLNVSSGTVTSVLSLWKYLGVLTHWTREPVFGARREGDIPHSVMDNYHTVDVLDWSPGVSIIEGLEFTVEWAKRRRVAVGEAL